LQSFFRKQHRSALDHFLSYFARQRIYLLTMMIVIVTMITIIITERPAPMPMIDIYAAAGTFSDPHKLATDAAATVKAVEQVPDIPMFRKNTAAFVHELPNQAISNVDGDSNYVRVQVLTNAGALDRDKQVAVVRQLTDLIATAGGDPSLAQRTWVLLTEAPQGGWGLWGHAHTNEEIVGAARAEIAGLRQP
jgi:phenylpyruvate tautomerase PptA (4-oxalocrotonate tautomerase family)